MHKYHIAGGWIVNEGKIVQGDLLVEEGLITRVEYNGLTTPREFERIDANGLFVLPGVIDTHVHFREPGLTHKGTMFTESMDAIAGGICSIVDMPNTLPPTTSRETLEEKFNLAKHNMLVNFGFYVAATYENIGELPGLLESYVAGIKLFYGSTTGNLLFHEREKIEQLFSSIQHVKIAVHSEDDAIIHRQLALLGSKMGVENLRAADHPRIRSREACFEATSFLLDLALTYETELHFLHITTAEEVALLQAKKTKHITAETCVNYLWFTDKDYEKLGNLIKCNPAIKTAEDQVALCNALKEGVLDVLSSDHAPHTYQEKQQPYIKAPSGIPSIRFILPMMLTFVHQKKCTLTQVVDWMCHRPATLFRIEKRGFLQEGYYADLVLVDFEKKWIVHQDHIFSKSKWSPLLGQELYGDVVATFVNGVKVYSNGKFFLNNKQFANPLHFRR